MRPLTLNVALVADKYPQEKLTRLIKKYSHRRKHPEKEYHLGGILQQSLTDAILLDLVREELRREEVVVV